METVLFELPVWFVIGACTVAVIILLELVIIAFLVALYCRHKKKSPPGPMIEVVNSHYDSDDDRSRDDDRYLEPPLQAGLPKRLYHHPKPKLPGYETQSTRPTGSGLVKISTV